MRLSRCHPHLILSLISTVSAFQPSLGAVLYSEDFNAAGSTLGGESWSGWGALGDTATATTYTSTSTASPESRLTRIAGSGPSKALFAQSRNSGGSPTVINDRFVAVTTAIGGSYTPGLDESTSLGSIVWEQSLTAATSQSVQVLVQVAGAWYASLASYSNAANSSAGAPSNTEIKSLDLAGAQGLGTNQWYQITFGDGSPITLGSQVSTPIGNTLTGLGFALFTGSGAPRTIWIDNVQLVSVPEPSVIISSAAAGLLLLRRRRGN